MDAKTMMQTQVSEWFKAARGMMGDELASMIEAHLSETTKALLAQAYRLNGRWHMSSCSISSGECVPSCVAGISVLRKAGAL